MIKFVNQVVTDKFASIPILVTLWFILQNPNLRNMFTSSHTLKVGMYSDFKDSLYIFQTKSMQYKLNYFMMALRLLIHWDPKEVYINWGGYISH